MEKLNDVAVGERKQITIRFLETKSNKTGLGFFLLSLEWFYYMDERVTTTSENGGTNKE